MFDYNQHVHNPLEHIKFLDLRHFSSCNLFFDILVLMLTLNATFYMHIYLYVFGAICFYMMGHDGVLKCNIPLCSFQEHKFDG